MLLTTTRMMTVYSPQDRPLILVVDDDAYTRRMLGQLLERERYRVSEVQNGEQCLAAYQSLQPDLVLLDISLPGMDGFTCCTELQRLSKGIGTPILMIVARIDDRSAVDRAFKAGATDYIAKPIQRSVLRQRISRLLEQAQLYKQLQEAERVLELTLLDPLTQVASRATFDLYLEREWRRMAREATPLSLLVADIDGFTAYNSECGQQAGNNCLQQIARALNKAAKRPADLVARFNGDEFAVILPNTHAAGALHVGQRTLVEVRALQIARTRSSFSPFITLSLGVASMVPCHDSSPTLSIDLAQKALSLAKARGGDCVIQKEV